MVSATSVDFPLRFSAKQPLSKPAHYCLRTALPLQRAALTPGSAGRSAFQAESLSPGIGGNWQEKKDRLILGRFQSSGVAAALAAIALLFLLMFFAPSYPVLRWFAVQPVTAACAGTALSWRF